MQANRYIHLSAEEITPLAEGVKHHRKAHLRTRCETLLLSNGGYKVLDLAQLFEVRTHTVRFWMDNWAQKGLVGLSIGSGRGRTATLQVNNAALVEELHAQFRLNRQSLEQVAVEMSKKWHCSLWKGQLQRFIKKARLPLATLRQVYKKVSRPPALPKVSRAAAGRPRLSITLAGGEGLLDDLLWAAVGLLLRTLPYGWQPADEYVKICPKKSK